MSREENPQRENELDSPSFEGFRTQLDCKLTYSNENQKQSIKHSCSIYVKRLACFYELQFGRISPTILLSDSVLETKKLQEKTFNSTRRTIINKFVNYCRM